MKSKPERFRVKTSSLETHVPLRITWLQALNRVLIDPDLGSAGPAEMLDLLFFLTDVVIVVDPTRSNLSRWHYDAVRFSELVNHKMFLPLFSGNNSGYYATEVYRRDLFDDDQFWVEYEKTIEQDLEDDIFCELAQQLNLDVEDAAFSLNWDLINAQLLNAPIVSSKSFQPLFEYKLKASTRDVQVPTSPSVPAKDQVLRKFLYRVLGTLPYGLDVSQLIEFRKDHRAERFRNWFSDELLKASEASKIARLAFDQKIYDDFLELTRNYDGKGVGLTAGVSGLAGIVGSAFGAVIGGPIGAAAGAAPSVVAPYAFSKVIKRVWEKTSKHNWVFLFLDVRQKKRDT